MIIELAANLAPGFGFWSATNVEFASPEETISQSNPASVSTFFASVSVLFLTSGTVIKFSELLSSSVVSEGTPKYGNISDNICETTGAATEPP